MAATTTARPAAKTGSSARPSATRTTTSKPQGALTIRSSGGVITMSGGFDMSWELTPAQCRTYGQALLAAADKATASAAKSSR